ncbi:MAG TPA: hypothetical protein VEO73_11615 [Gemmatimonadales bacterium]|nr:hypothetical protein [Gemmatimonadales bacterium]
MTGELVEQLRASQVKTGTGRTINWNGLARAATPLDRTAVV